VQLVGDPVVVADDRSRKVVPHFDLAARGSGIAYRNAGDLDRVRGDPKLASHLGTQPSQSQGREPQEVDFYHWSAVLRSVSGFEVYRKVYRNVIRPDKVAELLILRPDMPRSLAACMNEVVSNLRLVANAQSAETLRRAGRIKSDLQYGHLEEILDTGLHAYLTQFLDRVGDLGVGISRDFLVPMAA